MFFNIGVLENFAIFTGKHLRYTCVGDREQLMEKEVKINTYCEIPSLPNVSNL